MIESLWLKTIWILFLRAAGSKRSIHELVPVAWYAHLNAARNLENARIIAPREIFCQYGSDGIEAHGKLLWT